MEGEGKLIGLDNGNPVDHISIKSNQRKTFNVLAPAVLQSTNTAGKIHIEVSSPNVLNASADINTQKVIAPVATIEDLKK